MAATKTTSAAPDMSAWTTAGRNVKFTQSDGFLFIAVPINAGCLIGDRWLASAGADLRNGADAVMGPPHLLA